MHLYFMAVEKIGSSLSDNLLTSVVMWNNWPCGYTALYHPIKSGIK